MFCIVVPSLVSCSKIVSSLFLFVISYALKLINLFEKWIDLCSAFFLFIRKTVMLPFDVILLDGGLNGLHLLNLLSAKLNQIIEQNYFFHQMDRDNYSDWRIETMVYSDWIILMTVMGMRISFISGWGLLSFHRILMICLTLLWSWGLSTFYPHVRCSPPLSERCWPTRSWIGFGRSWRPRRCILPCLQFGPFHAFWGWVLRGRFLGWVWNFFWFCRRWSHWIWEVLCVPSTFYINYKYSIFMIHKQHVDQHLRQRRTDVTSFQHLSQKLYLLESGL